MAIEKYYGPYGRKDPLGDGLQNTGAGVCQLVPRAS